MRNPLTPAHIDVLRQLVAQAQATNSDVGMDVAVLAALLDLVSPPADFPPAEDVGTPEHIVRCYARIHRLTTELGEAEQASAHVASRVRALRGTIEAALFQLDHGEASDLLDGTIDPPEQLAGYADATRDLLAIREQMRAALAPERAEAQAMRLLNHDEEAG